MVPSMICLTNSPMISLAHPFLAFIPGHAAFLDDLVQKALLFLNLLGLRRLCLHLLFFFSHGASPLFLVSVLLLILHSSLLPNLLQGVRAGNDTLKQFVQLVIPVQLVQQVGQLLPGFHHLRRGAICSATLFRMEIIHGLETEFDRQLGVVSRQLVVHL